MPVKMATSSNPRRVWASVSNQYQYGSTIGKESLTSLQSIPHIFQCIMPVLSHYTYRPIHSTHTLGFIHFPFFHSTIFLTVKSVIDTVNNVIRGRSLGNKTTLVLLDNLGLSGSKTFNLVKISNSAVGSVGNNLSSNSWVHTGHLEVSTYVCVVNVYNVWSSEVSNVLVIYNSVCCGGESECSSSYGCLGEELTASCFCGESGGGLGACVRSESSSGTVCCDSLIDWEVRGKKESGLC